MNYSIIRYMLGWVLKFEGCFLTLPLIVGVIYREAATLDFFICIIICFAAGFVMTRRKPRNTHFYAREGFVTVALSWILLSAIGSLPFIISGEIPSPVDAMFEIISGFTTTGASILTNVESLSRSTMFWRCFSHWIGGMGILVFILAILPQAGGQDMYLMRAESPGPSVGKLVPRIQKTAFLLYAIYFFMTIVEIIFLLAGKMPLFDALCTAFGTAGTGGFGIKADSIAGYSAYHQSVITVFMFLFGINFNFYFSLLLLRNFRDAFHMEEVRWYFIIFISAVLLITVNLTSVSGGFFYNLHHSAFQVSSIMTTTGFSTVDFNTWPTFSRTILIILMFIGACAGSTGGGMKVSRILIYFKTMRKELSFLIHPRSIKILKMDAKKLEHEVIRSANIFFISYALIFTISLLIIGLDNFDLTTNFTAVAATFNNIGPGLELVGPAGNFSRFSDLSKIVLMFDMLAGRLEIFPMLLLVTPATWRR